MVDTLETTHSNTFSRQQTYEFQLLFHRTLFVRVQLTILQHWVRKWLGANQATSHYPNQLWPSLLTRICVIYASFYLFIS